MKNKMEPATNRIKRLLEVLSYYSFNLFYIKGKDKILSDFLSRQIEDDSNPHEIIPISFNIREILQENYHNIVSDTYKVQTRAQAKAQTDAPIVSSTQAVAWKATPKITHQTGKEKGSKTPPSRLVQQPPIGIVIPPGAIIPPIIMPPSVRLPPKTPNIDNATTNPNLGPDPNVDIEGKFTPSRGNHIRDLCSPRSVLPRAATGADQVGKYLKSGGVVSPVAG